jgi:hypothetical protein
MILCGWRVRSCIALPELLSWIGDDRPVDVEILFGQITEPSEMPIFIRPHSRLWANGFYLLIIEGVGRFSMKDGKQIVIEPVPGIAESELRVFLLGTVLGVLCHQRGLLPVHASAVNINGRAVLFSGNSGAGKSTMAAALGQRGHPLMADDIVAITPETMALPAFPQRKLALDVLDVLTLDHAGLLPNRPGQPKYRVSALEGFDSAPLRPLSIYMLGGAMPGRTDEIVLQNRVASIAWLNRMLYRRKIGMMIQPSQRMLNAIARLAQAVPVYTLTLGSDLPLADLGKLAERVEAHAVGLQ